MLSHVISCHKTFYHVIWKSSKMQHRWLPNNLFYKPNIICFKLFVLFLQCFIILNNTKGSILMHESLPTFVFTPLEYIYIYSMEKAMAPHSSILAWKIPWTEKPGRLQSVGSLRVGYNWVTSLSLFTVMHWRRKWQPTPVFLSGESQGWGSLVGFHLWGHAESDMTEVT